MKIATLVSSTSRNAGGVSESVRKLVQYISQSSQYEVATFGLQDENTQQDLEAWGDLSVSNFPIIPPRSFGYAPTLLNVLLAAKLDIIHLHGIWMYPQWACWRWAKRQHKPYIVSPHGMLDPWAVRNSRWKKAVVGWMYANAQLKGAACIHALCVAEAQAIRAYGLRNPICVIPNGIEIPQTTVSAPPSWRSTLPPEARILFYLGRLHPKKGLSQLLSAWAAARRPDGAADVWHLVLAGWDQDGHAQELKQLTQQLGIQDSVHFIGPQFDENKHACFSHADAFILPSLSEGLPMTVLEAWSYGLPVLMTPECNLPEGFAENAALAIKPEATQIAQGLATLFSMGADERQAMGGRGRKLVEDRFTWPTIATDMRAVYAWALGQGPQPSCILTD